MPSSATTHCEDIDGQNSSRGTAETVFDVSLLHLDGYISKIAGEAIQYHNTAVSAEFLGHEIWCNDTGQHCIVECGQLAGCLSSTMYIGVGANDSYSSRDVVILCDEQVSCFGATVNAEDLRQLIYITIICNAESACNGMTITALNFESLHVYCSQSEACSDMVVHLDVRDDEAVENEHEGRYGSIWCTVPNACDGLMINTSSIWTTLWMFEWSDDVVLANGYGYEDNIECNNNRFIKYRQWINETDDTITESISSEYESDYFPCDGVQVQCNGSSCDMEYNLNSQQISSLESTFGDDDCYWLNVEDIQNLNCIGECVTSPTTSPTAAPTAVPSVPTQPPTTFEPTVDPTRDPTTDPSEIPTNSPTVEPTAYPTNSPSLSPSNSPTETPTTAPSFSPSQSPTRLPTVYPTYDVYIAMEYSLHNLSTADKRTIYQDAASVIPEMAEILERGYLERSSGNLEYSQFSLRIESINDVIIDSLIDTNAASGSISLFNALDVSNEFGYPVVLGVIIDILTTAASLITGNSDDQFEDIVQIDIQNLFNNSNVTFRVSTLAEEIEIVGKYSQEQSSNNTPLYSAITILSIGAVSSAAAFIWDKVPFTNSDESRWMAPMFLAIHLYDFVSDIILCYTISKSALNEGFDHNSTLLWLAIGSAATIIVPLLLNTLYAMRIRRERTIIGNPTASNWCVISI